MDSYLRLAKNTDMDLLFEWANDPSVRKNSFSSEDILYEEHQKWFDQLMKDQNCRQYIYMHHGRETGQIRLTVHGESAEISYSICPEKRGQGHGKRILELICEQVKRDFPEIMKLEGRVKPENMTSRKAFLKSGFLEEYVAYKMDIDKFITDKDDK